MSCNIGYFGYTFRFNLIYSDEDWQKLDDMGALIEQLLQAQNQTHSKLSKLIHILQRIVNATGIGKFALLC